MIPQQKVVDIIQKTTRKYHDTTLYIAVVVTLILILQIVTLTKGG